jgi:hypothetical protein
MASPVVRLLVVLAAATCCVVSPAAARIDPGHGGPPPVLHNGPWLTLLFSRTEVTLANRCVADRSNVANLLTVVAPELWRRRLRPTGTVETGVTTLGTPGCVHSRRALTATWRDLRHLRNDFHWTFVSHSATYATNLAALSPRALWAETCGTVKTLERHGHLSANGLFAYPDNKWTMSVQRHVARCFAFGRQYAQGPGTRQQVTAQPYFQPTEGISGGRCNMSGAACATLPTITRYKSPPAVAHELATLKQGQWLTLQAYLLVTGSRPGMWDCTSPNWRLHWSTDPERYCWTDYLTILDSIPGNVGVLDPKSVARAWGRLDSAYSPTPPPPKA